MIVLDTNVVSELVKTSVDASVKQWITETDPRDLVMTAVSRAEIMYGIARLPEGRRQEQLRRDVSEVFGTDPDGLLPFDAPAADWYGEIIAERERGGRPIGVLDAQIAAIARTYGASVATRNVRDFEGVGVEVVNPFE
ncbi:MAG: type II toxin-antitoxin system VapC family toxin [Scrofimicrobium sp.]